MIDARIAGCVPIEGETDIIVACQKGRSLAAEIGFDGGEQVAIAIAISEVARNILDHAGRGQIKLLVTHRTEGRASHWSPAARGQAPFGHRSQVSGGETPGIQVMACDEGPGIADVELALRDGFTTGRGLGVGLPGARRLMDEIDIDSQLGTGTTVTVTKWLR